jgi:hypothetical protein
VASLSVRRTPFSTPAAPAELPRAPGVGDDGHVGGHHRVQPLLSLDGLGGELRSEERGRCGGSIAAGTGAPATHHPVVPAEDRALGAATSLPPTSRYSRLNEQAIARSGITADHSLEGGIDQLLVGAGDEATDRGRPRGIDHRAGRPGIHLDGSVEAGIHRISGKKCLVPARIPESIDP